MPQAILVVEDEPDIRELLTFTIGRAGYDVIAAETAEQALQKMGEGLPELVLIDWMLPGMDGVELARRMRQDVEKLRHRRR